MTGETPLAVDVSRLVGAVTRELSTRDKDGSPAHVLVATRTYDPLAWGLHGQVSWVTVELSDDPAGGTVLRLEHMAHVPAIYAGREPGPMED